MADCDKRLYTCVRLLPRYNTVSLKALDKHFDLLRIFAVKVTLRI